MSRIGRIGRIGGFSRVVESFTEVLRFMFDAPFRAPYISNGSILPVGKSVSK